MNPGPAIDRKDGRLKVLGQAKYAAEFSVPDLAHAVLVQSTIAAGTVEEFDLAAATGMPGVLAILTPENAPRLNQEDAARQTVLYPLLQDKNVRYNGQHVAVVVADTLQKAQAAASAVRVRYRSEEAVTSMNAALHSAYEPKTFAYGRAVADSRKGDPDAAMSRAAVRVEAIYVTPVEHHNPMEPHATIAKWDGDKLTVWTATQGISGAQATLATLFGLDKENVTVLSPFVGGGFGCKGNTWPPTTLAAMAARHVGRPVKLELTRQQMFTSNGYRPRTVQTVQLAAEPDGRLLAIRHAGLAQMSMPELGEFTEPVALATRMLYAAPNIATSHRLVGVNQGLPTYMRAPGEASGMFALESAMDELAVALRIDPVELRLRNYAYTDPTEGKPFASKALRECYRRGAEAFGWPRRTPEPSSMRDGRVLIGWGMATSTYPTNRSPGAALVRLLPDGTALVQSGTQDIGTGTYTTMAQIAAEELGLDPARVRAELGDSRLPPAPVSGGSMTSASVLPAVQQAARRARLRLIALAAAQHESWRNIPEDAFRLRDGMLYCDGSSEPGQVSVASVLARAGQEYLEGRADAKPAENSEKYSKHAFGAQFAEVRIDPDLRSIKVSRWVGAFDCGRVINAKTARSQLIGGIVFGMGMALFEETRVDAESGRIVNANIAEYLVPVNADVPEIETIVVEAEDTVTTPLGLKGIGELPMVGVAPAIANAVYHATGVRVRELPIRLDKILA
jgi:xanthine dehydrogenase YagR molybdenum-binding subunit